MSRERKETQKIQVLFWHRFSWVIDLVIVGLLVLSVYASWTTPLNLTQQERTTMNQFNERNLSLSAVSGAVSATMTTASIILSVAGAIVALGKLPPASTLHFLIAGVECGISLMSGVFIMAALPQIAWKNNVAFSPYVGTLLGVQIYVMLPAVGRLLIGIYHVLRKTS